MNKSIILLREDFIENLIALVNDSGLPAFVVEPILSDMLTETRVAMQKQLEIEREKYNQEITSSTES